MKAEGLVVCQVTTSAHVITNTIMPFYYRIQNHIHKSRVTMTLGHKIHLHMLYVRLMKPYVME